MKVAFFSEMEFQGKILRTHENMRVEFAWMATLKADHYTLGVIPNVEYDIALVLNSKTKPNLLNVKKLKSKCKLVAILQEGPNWNFQDYSIQNQIHYYIQIHNTFLNQNLNLHLLDLIQNLSF